MLAITEQFIHFCLEHELLGFGEFQLKSGRTSPYYFNFGALMNDGQSLNRLGKFYADAIDQFNIDCDQLFGPAYKGIPIVVATAMAFYQQYRYSLRVTFNRKTIKHHGEGGRIVGAAPQGKLLILDDVLTSGLATIQALEILDHYPLAQTQGLLVGLDRQEKNELSGIKVYCLATFTDIMTYIEQSVNYRKYIPQMQEYHRKYAMD